ALAILIASATAYVRVLTEIGVAAPRAFGAAAPPLVVLAAWLALVRGGLFYFRRGEHGGVPPPEYPAGPKAAPLCAGLYALVLVGMAAARDYFSEAGLYALALLSGLHDLDAVTLSTVQLVDRGQVGADTGWRIILAASLANLVAKAALVALLAG